MVIILNSKNTLEIFNRSMLLIVFTHKFVTNWIRKECGIFRTIKL